MRSGFICSKGFNLFPFLLAGAFALALCSSAGKAEEGAQTPNRKSPCGEGMVYIPAGPFWMGCNKQADPECEQDELPYHEVYVDAFCIDATEVTVEAYEECVAARECPQTVKGSTCNFLRKDRRGHPVNCVNLKKAEMFCEWKGKRLPTEAEWEKAARGTDGRIFPWGSDTPSCEYTVMLDAEGKGCGRGTTWPVGSKGRDVSPYGVKDMAGNVSEWVADLYGDTHYRRALKKNPPGPRRGSVNVFRGGNWAKGNVHTARASDRNPNFRILWSPSLGMRCATEAGKPGR